MAFEVDESGRIGQSGYWMWFGIYFIGTIALLVGGVLEIFKGAWISGALTILAVLPLGIYFRVIVMRRCRDIGWPAALPWMVFGLQITAGVMLRPRLGEAPTAAIGMLAVPALLGLGDFVLTIVVGCLPTKAHDWSVFDDDFDPTDLPQAPKAYLDDLPPIAPQAKAYRMPRAIDEPLPASTPAPAPRAMPSAPGLRPAGGFGRKAV